MKERWFHSVKSDLTGSAAFGEDVLGLRVALSEADPEPGSCSQRTQGRAGGRTGFELRQGLSLPQVPWGGSGGS